MVPLGINFVNKCGSHLLQPKLRNTVSHSVIILDEMPYTAVEIDKCTAQRTQLFRKNNRTLHLCLTHNVKTTIIIDSNIYVYLDMVKAKNGQSSLLILSVFKEILIINVQLHYKAKTHTTS